MQVRDIDAQTLWQQFETFMWGMAEANIRYQNSDVKIENIKTLAEIADFKYLGDCLVLESPTITRGEYQFAAEYADKHGFEFFSSNGRGTVWVLRNKNVNIVDKGLEWAHAKNTEVSGREIAWYDWLKERKHFLML